MEIKCLHDNQPLENELMHYNRIYWISLAVKK
jgi:hypothetical protein